MMLVIGIFAGIATGFTGASEVMMLALFSICFLISQFTIL